MCGINGIVYSRGSGRTVNADLLMRMRDSAIHRGPDDAGMFIERDVGLGHRRLSIVDLSHGGQPMFNEDRSCVIVYNGEVYNHVDHRTELIERGYVYRSTSDTETILHLYEAYGADCVHKLRGMFAFAIWNRNTEELFVARDRFGVKPLYYVHDDEGDLYFASEIKSLLEAKAVKPELNYSALPDQLANHGLSGDETLFKGVRRLPPGHFLKWKDGKISIERYWDLEFEPKNAVANEADAVAEWYEMFRESVRLRLMSDVPLGMFLSGGIDSSAIAAVMSGLTDEPVKTFSVGFDERGANEFAFARSVAKKFKTDHREITITPEQFFAELPRLVWHEDEPLGFEASVPLYFVSRLAGEHVKVVLTGEGSDEILGGYGRYKKALSLLGYGEKYNSFAPEVLRGAVRSGVAVLPRVLNRRLTRTFLTREADVENLYFDNFAIFGKDHQKNLFTRDTAEKIDLASPYADLQGYFNDSRADGLLDRLLHVDTKSYLHELLMKQDQMSMAASIESRVPFLDHKLVEFSARLPERFKLRGRDTKWILRRAMQGLLPPEIIERPKMGFPVPLGDWLRGGYKYLVDDYLLSERSVSRGIFERSAVERLVMEHSAGENHTSRIFRLINLEIWHRIFIDGEDVRANRC